MPCGCAKRREMIGAIAERVVKRMREALRLKRKKRTAKRKGKVAA